MNRIVSLFIISFAIMLFFLASPAICDENQFIEINSGSLEGMSAGAVSLGDIDNDGDLDLVSIGDYLSGDGDEQSWNKHSRIYQNDGSGYFTEINPGTLIDMRYGSTSLGDIDNDGDLDLILSGDSGTWQPDARIYQNDGSGNFIEINPGSLESMMYGAASLGDIDNDGDLDFVLTGSNSSWQSDSRIYQNDSSGNFIEINPGSLESMMYGGASLGDIDNDGDLDLILTGHTSSVSLSKSSIYQNDGSGSFAEINLGSLKSLARGTASLGDIDNDNDLDLILTGYNSSWQPASCIYQNDGSGSFIEINPGSLEGLAYSAVSLGDIDNDGDLDLIATGENGSNQPDSRIYLNDGSGGFTEIDPDSLEDIYFSTTSLGDIDGDSDLDLVITGSNPSGHPSAKIYQNNVDSNTPPIATDDTVSVDEDDQVTIDVLANDTDPDGDELYISSVTTPSFGTVTILGGIEIEYIPNPDAHGTDTFSYIIEDENEESDDAVVTVTVNSINDAPSAAAQIIDGLIDPANSKTLVAKLVTFQGYNITDIDTDDAALTCEWNFGDGSPTVAGVTTTHAYASAGTYTATLTVSDNETPPAYATVNIGIVLESAVDVIDDLVTVVESFNLQQGIANSLDSKLSNVLDALSAENEGNRPDAINKLQAFINSVEAQRGNKLTEEQADELIVFANDIIRSISN